MRDFVDLCVTTPTFEECAQIGSKSYDYYARAHQEARALIAQLRRKLGTEPEGARLSVKSHPHDFGNYLTVICYFDQELGDSVDYAFRCESEVPDEWDDLARKELALHEEERR